MNGLIYLWKMICEAYSMLILNLKLIKFASVNKEFLKFLYVGVHLNALDADVLSKNCQSSQTYR